MADEKIEKYAKMDVPKLTAEQEFLIQNAIQNGLGDVWGLGAFNPFGFPQNQAFPGTEQISRADTLFINLRWYLVSNFWQVLSQAYVELGLIQTIVDVPVDDALRGGVEIKSKQLSDEQVEELQISLDRDDDLNTVGQAAKWNRLYGGAGILILTDQDPELPLDVEAIGLNTPLEFRPVDMWELFWDKQNTEGYDPAIQTQTFEYYNYYAEQVHKSRVMRMKGFIAPAFVRPRLRGWGFSVVEILIRSINQYLKSTDLTFEVLDEFKLDVYKIKNLVNTLISSPNGTQAVQKRVDLANKQKNYQHAIVMDSEDDFDYKQLSFAGLAEAQQGIRMQVASDLRMPLTKLFGISAAGFNSGEDDIEVYNGMIESQVRNKIKYDILRICEIKCQKLFGFIPDDLSLTFKPLRVLSAIDEENVKTQKFNRLLAAQQAGLIDAHFFAESANKGALFDALITPEEDMLNPNDGEIVKEGGQDPTAPTDIADPGANREDTRKTRAWEWGGIPKRDPKMKPRATPAPTDSTAKKYKPAKPTAKIGNAPLVIMPEPYTLNEKIVRAITNSLPYDIKAYEKAGGDKWMDPDKFQKFFQQISNPGKVDEAKWSKAKKASEKAFGKVKWPFVTWLYKKMGGTFH